VVKGIIVPILPENKKRYPADWKAIRDKILSECQNKCEWCGVENGTMRGDKKIVLTIAHLDHVPEHCARENLRALCQKCHNGYDAKHRAQTRKRHFAVGQYELFEGVNDG
jgi:5-methylcytosine-specific restriction endonuclease McrA